LVIAAVVRGIDIATTAVGVAWFVAAASLFTVGMYGAAETLASRVPKQEEYIARVPAIAIVPWFLAGSLFPIAALPVGLEWFARILPVTHALALMRYGLLGSAQGLSDIWGMASVQTMAWLSLGVAATQLAKLGGGCLFFTALGDDGVAEDARGELERSGVEVHAAAREEPTRTALTMIDDAYERTIVTLGDRLEPRVADPLPWERL